jgi:hypothetical protein
MSRVDAFVDDFLAHYASEYYDPAKAREYYLRTRELKGQQSTSQLTKKGDKGGNERRTQAWTYAKNQISEEKKANLEALSAKRKEVVDRARESAQARREEISSKLTALLELLTKQKTDDAEAVDAAEEAELEEVEQERAAKSRKIREDAQRAIAAIPAIPDGVRGPARERLVAARAKKIARITGNSAREIGAVRAEAAAEREAISADADSLRKDLSTQTQAQKEGERESSRANREKVVTDLKASVDKARADYEAGKERLIAEYEQKQQQEFDAIRTRVR